MRLDELERATLQNMRRDLKIWYALSSRHERKQATEWYWQAHLFAGELASEYGITVAKAAAVMSVLSPGVKWEQNKKDAKGLIAGVSEGRYDATVSTYNPQKWKAYHILDAHDPTDDELEDMIGTPGARKTRAFYRNILDPTDDSYITIDRWILRALGLPVNRTTERLYYIGSMAIRSVARELGLLPCQCQAIVWTSVRNRKGDMNTTTNLPGF